VTVVLVVMASDHTTAWLCEPPAPYEVPATMLPLTAMAELEKPTPVPRSIMAGEAAPRS
jgi:hypothetical protein